LDNNPTKKKTHTKHQNPTPNPNPQKEGDLRRIRGKRGDSGGIFRWEKIKGGEKGGEDTAKERMIWGG